MCQYDAWTTVNSQVFWSHKIALGEKQTKVQTHFYENLTSLIFMCHVTKCNTTCLEMENFKFKSKREGCHDFLSVLLCWYRNNTGMKLHYKWMTNLEFLSKLFLYVHQYKFWLFQNIILWCNIITIHIFKNNEFSSLNACSVTQIQLSISPASKAWLGFSWDTLGKFIPRYSKRFWSLNAERWA